ncbi:MAG: cold shock domain-containing protein [Lachnospiraceae bacterium]|nr:cold shock domain-containing protein [Lachnospiraceae bacterium]
MKGTVKWFNNQKGYGFITDEEGKDIFLHYSGLQMEGFKSIEEGAQVEFKVSQGEKGPQAVNVVRV